MNNKHNKKNLAADPKNICYAIGFSAFAMLVFTGFALVPGFWLMKNKEKEKILNEKISNFVSAQPNYTDSLVQFDAINGKEMAEWEIVIKYAKKFDTPVPDALKQQLKQKIDHRNRLVIKKMKAIRAAENYADSLQKANNIKLSNLRLKAQEYSK